MTQHPNEHRIHHGRNIKRFREMLGIKQEALAQELGEDWSQRKVSLLEAKEEVDEALLQRIALVLKVPAEAIRNFDEETAMVNIQNNYDNSAHNMNGAQYNFNPIEKIMELYERMLKQQEVLVERLERLLQEKK
jgi:transcriptional regulator with XRE-family HTH domain